MFLLLLLFLELFALQTILQITKLQIILVTKYYPFAGKTRSKVDRNVSGWETINFCYG